MLIRLGIPQSALAFIFIGQGSRTSLQVGLYKNFQNKMKPTRITTGQTAGAVNRVRRGINPPSSPSPFSPPSWTPPVPCPPSLFHGREEEEEGLFCPKAPPSLPSYSIKNPPPFCNPFSKKAPPFILFGKQPHHHIK